MGITYIEAQVFTAKHQQIPVQFLVVSGAEYSPLPRRVWNELELMPTRHVTVALADGTKLTRPASSFPYSRAGQLQQIKESLENRR